MRTPVGGTYQTVRMSAGQAVGAGIRLRYGIAIEQNDDVLIVTGRDVIRRDQPHRCHPADVGQVEVRLVRWGMSAGGKSQSDCGREHSSRRHGERVGYL